jgi:cyclophilin family peptidyl-prolyl cis-trans isomerase
MRSKYCFAVALTGLTTLFFLLTAGCDNKEANEKTAEQVSVKTTTETDQSRDVKTEGEIDMTAEKQAELKANESLKIELQTNMGNIVIKLNKEAAPITVKNFLGYVNEGFYDGTIFHRVIKGFMIQGGGMTTNMRPKQTRPPIKNEANNGLKNDRGTIAMARTNNPHSAKSQFFINLKDNDFLNYVPAKNHGYAVFGMVVEGMEVVDKIAAVKTTRKHPYADVPAEAVVIEKTHVLSDR